MHKQGHRVRPKRRVRPAEFAARLGVSLRTLYNEIAAGRIEPPDRLTPRTSSWTDDYVDEVVSARTPYTPAAE